MNRLANVLFGEIPIKGGSGVLNGKFLRTSRWVWFLALILSASLARARQNTAAKAQGPPVDEWVTTSAELN